MKKKKKIPKKIKKMEQLDKIIEKLISVKEYINH